MKIRIWLLVIFLVGSFTSSAHAHNNYFLPGDAFFSVSITREVIEEWMANSEAKFEFSYSRFDGQFMACGNLGYTKLRIEGIDDNFRAALAEAYWRYTSGKRPVYRQEGDDAGKLSQINGVVALIYNADFNGPLGLKLNEDWQTQGDGRYCGLYETARATVMDWKLGPKYPALKLMEKIKPLVHLNVKVGVHNTISAPLVAKASKLKIVLVGFPSHNNFPICENLQKIYEFEEYSRYISVDLNGFEISTYQEGSGWEKTRIEVPVAKGKSWIPKGLR